MSKPRIIAGLAKGRTLQTPKHGTRPSPSRVREALFNKLAFIKKGHFLDLYSGSGAIGLEAASRGWKATCIDLSKEASQVIKHNANALKLEVTVMQTDALSFIQKTEERYDIVFAAPPYPLDLEHIFQTIVNADIARKEGYYVFQHPSQLTLSFAEAKVERRRYGSNALSFLRLSSNTKTR